MKKSQIAKLLIAGVIFVVLGVVWSNLVWAGAIEQVSNVGGGPYREGIGVRNVGTHTIGRPLPSIPLRNGGRVSVSEEAYKAWLKNQQKQSKSLDQRIAELQKQLNEISERLAAIEKKLGIEPPEETPSVETSSVETQGYTTPQSPEQAHVTEMNNRLTIMQELNLPDNDYLKYINQLETSTEKIYERLDEILRGMEEEFGER